MKGDVQLYVIHYLENHCVEIVDPTFKWPSEANFDDRIIAYNIEEKDFVPAPPMELIDGYKNETFMGYYRNAVRGVGTRNYVVVFSISSTCSIFILF